MAKLILEFDDTMLVEERKILMIKETAKGRRQGKIDLHTAADVLNSIFEFEMNSRNGLVMSKFNTGGILATKQNGGKWCMLKEFAPARRHLVSAGGNAFHVPLPRVIALVGNKVKPYLWWTDDDDVQLGSKLYPLRIGNVYENGMVCMGNTGIKLNVPGEIDTYVSRILEAHATNHLLEGSETTDALYKKLEETGWDPSIGKRKHTTVEKVIELMAA